MQELEKILEEIEMKKKKCLDIVRVEIDPMEITIHREQYKGLRMAEDIIRKHMDDGWISVEERLPEDNIEVLITYADMEDEKETGIAITTYGYATLGGKKLYFKEWRSPFLYFKENYKVIAWRPLPEPYRPERSDK